jgi:hypothetical protein
LRIALVFSLDSKLKPKWFYYLPAAINLVPATAPKKMAHFFQANRQKHFFGELLSVNLKIGIGLLSQKATSRE